MAVHRLIIQYIQTGFKKQIQILRQHIISKLMCEKSVINISYNLIRISSEFRIISTLHLYFCIQEKCKTFQKIINNGEFDSSFCKWTKINGSRPDIAPCIHVLHFSCYPLILAKTWSWNFKDSYTWPYK